MKSFKQLTREQEKGVFLMVNRNMHRAIDLNPYTTASAPRALSDATHAETPSKTQVASDATGADSDPRLYWQDFPEKSSKTPSIGFQSQLFTIAYRIMPMR